MGPAHPAPAGREAITRVRPLNAPAPQKPRQGWISREMTLG